MASTDDLLREARACVNREEWVKAWHLCNAALNEDSERPESLYLMGHVLRSQGHVGLALPILSKALAGEQRQPSVWMQFGACLHDLCRWEEAIQAFKVVHRMLPHDPMPPANIAGSLVNLGKWHDTINWANKALSEDSENYIAHIAATFANLALGRWKDGWQHARYLYGPHLDVKVYNPPSMEPEPTWDGTPGQVVVVQCDQGIGDILMFSQLFPRLQRDCRRVIVDTVDRLVPLLKRMFPQVDVYGTLKKKPFWVADVGRVDAHVHVSWLGNFYLQKDEDFERRPYMEAHPELLAKWQGWLAGFPKPWRGIAWRGGIQQTHKHLRSVELGEFAPIIDAGEGTVFDMSYQDTSREVAEWNLSSAKQIVRPPIDTTNFDDTVALLAALDEVVCVTTTLLHIRGALGLPCKVLVPKVAQWREAFDAPGGGMIWYAPGTVEFFRQEAQEDTFGPAIQRLSETL